MLLQRLPGTLKYFPDFGYQSIIFVFRNGNAKQGSSAIPSLSQGTQTADSY